MDITELARAIKQLTIVAMSSSGTTASIASVVGTSPIKDMLIYTAWGSLGVGMIGAGAWVVAKAWPPQAFTSPDVATDRDLTQIRKLAQKFFGDKVSSVDLMRQWVKKNPDLFEVVTRVRHIGRHRISTVDGYYCVLPVVESAARDLLAETRGINEISREEVCGPTETPSAVYIGAIACRSDAGKQLALQGLRRMVKHFGRTRHDMPILTRPITDDGLRLVTAFGFQPVRKSVDNPIGVLHMQTMGAFFPRKGRRTGVAGSA